MKQGLTDRGITSQTLGTQPLVFVFLVFALPSLAHALGAVTSTLADTPPASVQMQLRTAVQDLAPSLGPLTPSQQNIFADEVLPQAQRFVRGYKNEAGKLNVQVDVQSIKRYLALAAGTESKLQYTVLAEPDCVKCVTAAAELKKILTARAERRGFKWIEAAPPAADVKKFEAKNYKEIDKVIEYFLGSRTGKKNAGYLYLRVSSAQADDTDTAHADEVRYQVRIAMQLQLAPGTPALPYLGELTVMANDSLETAGARIATDALTDLGAQSIRAGIQKTLQTDGNWAMLWFKGPRDYATYTEVREGLEAAIQVENSAWQVDELYLSQARVGYRIAGAKEWSHSQIKQFLEKLTFSNQKRPKQIVEEPGNDTVERSVSFEL